MKAAIAGLGWITPLGGTLDSGWSGLMEQKQPPTVDLATPGRERVYKCLPIDEALVRDLGRTPRLRRSSVISYYTAAAGLAALADGGFRPQDLADRRVAVVFAVANGGVVYTRRFYEKIAREGANAASPLLFPETVYNAPASHLSALLGTNSATYSLVGDAAVGIEALALGAQLVETDEVDLCLVVSGEELDWVLCEAYGQWRLVDSAGEGGVYSTNPRGMRMSEGASAVLLSREGRFSIAALTEGVPFFRRKEIPSALQNAVAVHPTADLIVGSANGTFIDRAEQTVFAGRPAHSLFAPKSILGESLGSGALMQVICAALALERQELPGTARAPDWAVVNPQSRRLEKAETALVSVVGLNHQVAAVSLRRSN